MRMARRAVRTLGAFSPAGAWGGMLLALACALVAPAAAWGYAAFTTGGDPTGFTDFINKPNDFPSWDKVALTYKFDATFDTAWPNPAVKNQVRLAFQQWDTADATGQGATYSYGRANGWQNFGDIRSVAVHEIGHVLGLHHTDQASAANRNYRPSGGGIAVTPAVGNELMRSWINPGDYNHVLTHDELDGFARMYGHDLSFTEVSASSAADITIQAYTAGAGNWANGGWSGYYRTGDHYQGVRITEGGISFNDSSGSPLGFKTLGLNWDYQNIGGQPTQSFRVRTQGTNNPTPLFHYDNQGGGGANRFDVYGATPLPGGLSVNFKDDLLHTWSSPHSGNIPASEIIHVGLEQDVWDWTATSAVVHHPGGGETNAPLLSFHEWTNSIVTGTGPSGGAGGAAMEYGPIAMKVVARGLRIIGPENIASMLVSDLMLAPMGDRNLMLDQLNRGTLQQLIRDKQVFPVTEFGERQMGPGDDFYLIFEGTANTIPPEILKQGNYLFLDRPDLLTGELFVYAQSLAGDALVGNYGLLGVPVNGRLPDPATLALLALGGLAILRRKRAL